MLIAYNSDNNRIFIDEAVPQEQYYCPSCKGLLITRKGEIRRHHFAHKPGSKCTDTWYPLYDTSEWHYDWQSRFPKENQEIVLKHEGEIHRADVLTGRTVIVFQHSPISSANLQRFIKFYDSLGYKTVWLFDYTEQFSQNEIAVKDYGELIFLRTPKAFEGVDLLDQQTEIFFQLRQNEEQSIVKITDIRGNRFDFLKWYSETEFEQYVGLINGKCPPPELPDITEDKLFDDFCSRYKLSLNGQQKRAVRSVNGASLVLAVPGSGKTTVLIARIGYMVLCKHIPPERILAITYTKAATEDMRKRCAAVFGSEIADKVNFHTINSLSYKILMIRSQNRNKPPFEINENIKRSIIIKLYKEQTGEKFVSESVIQDIGTNLERIKNLMLSADDIRDIKGIDVDMKKMSESYDREMVKAQIMDYTDQVRYAFMAISNTPPLLNMLQDIYPYICVDEAQDTSHLQHRMIQLLARKYNNIFMVGDDDQSIYAFRGAYPDAMLDFKNDYVNPFIYHLDINYRSTQDITDKADMFIEKNTGRYKKHMVSARGEGQPAVLIPIKHREEQFSFLANTFAQQQTEAAVLYRNNDSAIPLADLLIRRNIPFAINKDLRKENDHPLTQFFEHQTVNDICCFLKLIVDPYDAKAFMQIYYKLGYGFKKQTAQFTCKKVKRGKMTVFEALVEDTKDYVSLQRKAYSFSDFFVSLSSLTTYEAISKIYEKGYKDYLINNDIDTGKVDTLKALAVSEPDIGKFLLRLNELSALIQRSTDRNSSIVLSTIHSAKGLEYDTVYLLDVFDGTLPKETSEQSPDYMEERRLFYVAMTRAKNSLFMFWCKSSRSFFVEEVFPKETSARLNEPTAGVIKKKTPTDKGSKISEYNIGDRVEIKGEGVGTITDIEEREFVSLGNIHIITIQTAKGEIQKYLELLVRENRIRKIY